METIIGEFQNKLSEQLEELFPKLNKDNIEKKSPNHRSEALVLNAFANVYCRDTLCSQINKIQELMRDTLSVDNPEVKKEVDKLYEKMDKLLEELC